MRVDVVTLFPELFGPFLDVSFVGRARAQGALTARLRSPRDFGLGKHRSVDDTPYGGGSGMVMRVDCLVDALESLDADAPDGLRAHRVLLTPTGAPFSQAHAIALSQRPAVALICGRYEGFDARIGSFIDEEISLGDFVMTGGEVAAMAVIEATVRLLPGVLGNEESSRDESHSPSSGGLLEYPQYTRPVAYRGLEVPEVLRQGNHKIIADWRHQQARALTGARRPDLLAAHDAAHPPPPPKKARRRRHAPPTAATPADGAAPAIEATPAGDDRATAGATAAGDAPTAAPPADPTAATPAGSTAAGAPAGSTAAAPDDAAVPEEER